MKTNYIVWLICMSIACLTSCEERGLKSATLKNKSTKQTEKNQNEDGVLPVEPEYERYWNDVSRYLAGLEPLPGSVLDSIDYRPEAVKHRDFFKQIWPNIQQNHVDKLAQFVKQELPEREQDRNVLYPFSGADFLHIHTVYPNGKKYVLYGLEPEGYIPDLRPLPADRLADNLGNLQVTLNTMLNLSFFRTSDMARSFTRNDLTGTVPVLMVFLARTGNEVLDISRIMINKKGEITYLKSDAIGMNKSSNLKYSDLIVTGIEIKFRRSKDAPTQTLQYFSFDAQDIHLKHQPNLFTYMKSLAPTSTYFKSASYLMHWDIYSLIRSNILEVSDVILQDDTGIALRKFDKSKWKFQVYGNYITPIPPFQGQFQQDLKQLYQTTNPKPLNFGIGYHNHLGTSNLMIARKIK